MSEKKENADSKDDIISDSFSQPKVTTKTMHKPYDALDMQYLHTEPAYGKEAPTEFYEMLQKLKGKAEPLYNQDGTPKLDEHGRQIFAVESSHLWDSLGYFTRDLRMGNLGNEDIIYCEHYLNIAGDLLSLGCFEAFTTALKKVISRIELSQSRDGFFRKGQNTIRQIRESVEHEGRKKKLFGGDKQEGTL